MLVDPQEKTPDFNCENCGAEMYGEDPLFQYNEKFLCAECYCKSVLNEENYKRMTFSEADAKAIANIFWDMFFPAYEVKEAI